MTDFKRLQKRIEKLENKVFDPADEIIEFLSKYEDYHVPGTADANIRRISEHEVYLEYPIQEHRSPNSRTAVSDGKLPDGWNLETIWIDCEEITLSFKHNNHHIYNN
jgi:hypothetical protein